MNLQYIFIYRKLGGGVSKFFGKALLNTYVDSVLPNTRVQPQFSLTVAPTGRLSSSSNKGVTGMLVKEKNGKYTTNLEIGTGDAGFNFHAMPSSPYQESGARLIKSLPPECGLNFDQPYGAEVDLQFYKSVVSLKVS